MKIHDSHFLGAESCDSGMTHGHVSSFLPNRLIITCTRCMEFSHVI